MYRSLLYNLLLHIHRHALVAGADKRTLARGHLDFLALVLRSIGLDRLAQMLVAVHGKTIDLLGLFERVPAHCPVRIDEAACPHWASLNLQ